MHSRTLPSTAPPLSGRVHARFLLTTLLIAAIVGVAGCGGKGPANLLTGKCTLDGKPVNGELIFVGADGQQKSCPVNPDGTYVIGGLPAGDYQVLVKGMAKPAGMMGGPGARPPEIPKDAAAMPGMPSAAALGQGVDPPKKYASQGNGLTVKVTGASKQSQDFTLTP